MKRTADLRPAAILVVATWTLSAILYLIPYHIFSDASLYVWVTILEICLLGALLSGGVYAAVRATRRRHVMVRFLFVGSVVILAAAILALIDAGTGEWLARLVVSPQRPVPFALRATNNFVALIWQFALLAAAFSVIEANILAREREQEAAAAREAATRAEAIASAARLAALRYQLNPHFLFNTLNAISSLIVTREHEAADAMLAKLSDFLRSTLATDADALIALEDELATLQHYLEIESVRFGDRLAVEFDCPPELNRAMVPSFLLQPLVENAIKYAVAPSADPVTIRVDAFAQETSLCLRIEDDGAFGNPAVPPGTGLGLTNVRQRLQTLYGSRAALETTRRNGGYVATLRLPLVMQGAEEEAQVA